MVSVRVVIHPLARMHGLSAYDAAYPELAIRHSLPLATRDGKLKNRVTHNTEMRTERNLL